MAKIAARIVEKELLVLRGHSAQVIDCAFSQDGKWIVSTCYDSTLKIWNLRNGKELHTLSGHTGPVNSCDISPDDKSIVSAGGKDLIIWDAKNGKILRKLTGFEFEVVPCAFSLDGKVIATYNGRKIWFLDSTTGKVINTFANPGAFIIKYSPDGTSIVTSGQSQDIKVWDVASGREIHSLSGHTGGVNDFAISPDGKWIVSVCFFDKILKIWDLNSGKELQTLSGHTSNVKTCAISPDGNLIVSASYDHIKLWDIASGEVLNTVEGKGSISTVAFGPGGKRNLLISGSHDGTVRLWGIH